MNIPPFFVWEYPSFYNVQHTKKHTHQYPTFHHFMPHLPITYLSFTTEL